MTSRCDRDRLRRLAGRYAEMATSAVMDARRQVWRQTNQLEARTVPFQIEDNGTFFAELMPPLECEGDIERSIEQGLLWALTNHEVIPDDRVFPAWFGIGWAIHRTSICPELSVRRAPDATGRELGYETNTPLADLANSFHKLRPTEFPVDRRGTERRVEIAHEAIGDILPVRIVGHDVTFAGTGLVQRAVHLVGMDDLYIAMMDQPENVHRLLTFLTDDAERFIDWLEAEGLITPNSHEMDVGSGSCGLTDELPRHDRRPGEPVSARDCWVWVEAQEAVGLSPTMYADFIYPYQKRIVDRFGLVYYGCCEAVHAFWPTLRGMANIRKVTMSPWCDQRSLAASVGESVVLSRKPHPLKLCGARFDPAEFEAHIRETLEAAEGRFVELVFRDTCTLDGTMKDRVAEACGIVRRLIGRGE